MNTTDALAELQEKYNKLSELNKLRESNQSLLKHTREAIKRHEERVETINNQYRKGVISDTEYAEQVFLSIKLRDAALAQELVCWAMLQP